jgi:formylmethanofuran dehydrogenase subunit E
MDNHRITLKEAVKFHGHLGPYLVLGILAGELALKELECKKYFGLEVKSRGAVNKPKSCLVDGLQLSTGATYGKGNIKRLSGREIKIEFLNRQNNKKLTLTLNKKLIKDLNSTQTHRDCELLAKKLYSAKDYAGLFNLS